MRLVRRAIGVTVLAATMAATGACTDDDPAAAPSSTSPTPPTSAVAAPTTTWPSAEGPFADGRTPVPGFGEVQVRVVDGPDGEPIILCVLVAETPDQRQQGLMGVTDLGGYDGMLFVYAEDHDGGFWMKNTLLPLSIAYLDADGEVVSTADMDPCPSEADDCPTYPPGGPFRWALEVPRGDLDPLGLVEGADARLVVDGGCSPAP